MPAFQGISKEEQIPSNEDFWHEDETQFYYLVSFAAKSSCGEQKETGHQFVLMKTGLVKHKKMSWQKYDGKCMLEEYDGNAVIFLRRTKTSYLNIRVKSCL